MRIFPVNTRRIVVSVLIMLMVATVCIIIITPFVRPEATRIVRDTTRETVSLSDVYITMKSSESYNSSRLTPLALTWLRKVSPKNVRSVYGHGSC